MRTHISRTIRLSAMLAVLFAAVPVSAQYFGRNKVQYKDLKFQVLQTEHFDVYFYPQGKSGVDISARLAERWYARLSRIFAHKLRGRQPLVLYASHPDFEQTNIIQGELNEGTGGVTEPLRRRIVLPLGGPLADTDHVIIEAEPQEWTRWYSVRVAPGGGLEAPVVLTPGEGAVEQSSLSPIPSLA